MHAIVHCFGSEGLERCILILATARILVVDVPKLLKIINKIYFGTSLAKTGVSDF